MMAERLLQSKSKGTKKKGKVDSGGPEGAFDAPECVYGITVSLAVVVVGGMIFFREHLNMVVCLCTCVVVVLVLLLVIVVDGVSCLNIAARFVFLCRLTLPHM